MSSPKSERRSALVPAPGGPHTTTNCPGRTTSDGGSLRVDVLLDALLRSSPKICSETAGVEVGAARFVLTVSVFICANRQEPPIATHAPSGRGRLCRSLSTVHRPVGGLQLYLQEVMFIVLPFAVLLMLQSDQDRLLSRELANVDSSSRKNAAKCCKVTKTWQNNAQAYFNAQAYLLLCWFILISMRSFD